MALEEPGQLGEFFLLLFGHPVYVVYFCLCEWSVSSGVDIGTV